MSEVALVSRLRFDPRIERVEYRRAGERLSDLVAETLPGASDAQLDRVEVTIISPRGSFEVPREQWRRWKTIEGRTVDIRLKVGGGNILKSILSVVILATATFLLGPGGALATSLGLSAFGSAVAIGTATAATQMLLNALIPSTPNTQDKPEQRYSISGARNTANPWGPVPAVLGRHRVYPYYGAEPYSEVVGDDEYWRFLFVVAYGPLELSDLRIGETPISKFRDVEIEMREGWPGDSRFTLVEECVFQDNFTIELIHDEGWTERQTVTATDAISIDIAFPTGLVSFTDKGDKRRFGVTVQIEYKKLGEFGEPDGPWIWLPEMFIEEDKAEAFKRSLRWEVSSGPGTYAVHLRRGTDDTDDDAVYDTIVWSALRSIRHQYPLQFPMPVAAFALRIKASKQLSGTLDQVNLLADAILPDWDEATSTWITRKTRNAASAARHVLSGIATALPCAADEINQDLHAEFHAWNVAKGFTYDRYHDFDALLEDVLAQIYASGRAARTQYGGLWGLIIDRPQTVLRGHISPRNASVFSGEIEYRDLPDAWRVKYLNELRNHKPDELIVVQPGFEGTPQIFEEMEFPGTTHPAIIRRQGRWRFADLMLRYETFYASQDIERLFAPRGSLVAFQYPVLNTKTAAARVKQRVGNRVLLDNWVTMEEGVEYACRFQLSTGATSLWTVATQPGRRKTLTLLAGATLPAVGNLAMFGIRGYEATEAIVKGVESQKNLAARLTLMMHAPEVEAIADAEAPPPVTPPPTEPPWAGRAPAKPVIIDVRSGSDAILDETGSPVVVRVRSGGGSVPVSSFVVTAQRGAEAPIDITVPASSGRGVFDDFSVGDPITVTAVAVSAYSLSSPASDPVTHTVKARTDLPADVATITLETFGSGGRRFGWTLDPAATDAQVARIAGYQFRSRPGAGWDWADLSGNTNRLVASQPYDTAEPLTAGPHTVGMVAIDGSGRLSLTPCVVDLTLGATSATLLAHRIEQALGWTGTLTAGTIGTGGLEGAGTPSTITYALPVINLGADLAIDVRVSEYGTAGASTIRMTTGLTADGAPVGAARAPGLATARYVAVTVTVVNAAALARLGDLVTLILPA